MSKLVSLRTMEHAHRVTEADALYVREPMAKYDAGGKRRKR
jgi:hypothetical protein